MIRPGKRDIGLARTCLISLIDWSSQRFQYPISDLKAYLQTGERLFSTQIVVPKLARVTKYRAVNFPSQRGANPWNLKC